MRLHELVRNLPACPHRSGMQCSFLSSKLDRVYKVSPLFCNLICRAIGPKSGKPFDLAPFLRVASIRSDPKHTLDNLLDGCRAASNFLESAYSRGFLATMLQPTGAGGERVDAETLAVRQQSCFGSETSSACPALAKRLDGAHFCAACKCGDRELARLDGPGYTKLHYPILYCPLERKGFTNWRGDENPVQ